MIATPIFSAYKRFMGVLDQNLARRSAFPVGRENLDSGTTGPASAPPPALARRAKSLRAFVKGRRGATALEFAILSIPFFLFLLFLFELGLDFYVQLALDYGVQEGTRELQTGAANSASSAVDFKTDCMCPAVAGFLNCNQISVTVYPLATTDYYVAARGGAGSVPLSGGALNTSSWSFSTGGGSTPMFIQAIYTSVSVVGLLFPQMSTVTGSGRAHITSSSIGYINEPFSTSSTVCGQAS